MAIDPNIALGYKPIQLEQRNPFQEYAQIAQIQNAQNQNALAQYQLSSAQRSDEQQNKLYSAAQQPNFKLDFQSAIQYGAPGIAAFKAQQEAANAALTQIKTQGEIDEKKLKLRSDKLNFAYNSVGSAPTPEAAAQKIKEGLKDGFLDFNTASAELKQIQDLRTPEDFQEYRLKKLMGILKEKDKVEFMLPKIKQLEAGGSVLGIQDNPTMPGYGLPIAGMDIKKTATIADNLAAAKFAFEKANPTMSIQEDPSGLLAVNTRTGVATPVVYGPMGIQAAPAARTAPAPAAAPGASMMRQPPAALPGQRIPAISGMASVLDQTAAPVAFAAMPVPSATGERVPGQPVAGKGKTPSTEYTKQAMGILNTNDALEKMQDTMKNFKSSDMLNPTRRAELGQAHSAALLFAKELFNLGVLNGGDERIINSVINNPINFSSTAVPIQAIRKQVSDLQGVVERTNKNLSTVYKLPPLKLERAAPSGAANDIHSQADAILRETP